MKQMSGGQVAVASLQSEKVKHVFGLIGSASMEMFAALYDASDINFIGFHDERNGTHMAAGYTCASGRAGCRAKWTECNQPGDGSCAGLRRVSPVVSIADSLSSAHVYSDAHAANDQYQTQ